MMPKDKGHRRTSTWKAGFYLLLGWLQDQSPPMPQTFKFLLHTEFGSLIL